MKDASARQAPETHPGMWSPPTTKRTLGSSYPELSSTHSKHSKWLFQKRAQNVGRNCCRSASNSQSEICARALKVAIKDRAMYTNILIPTDGSELAEKAFQHGIALAKRIGAKPARKLTPAPRMASRPHWEQAWMKRPAASKCGVRSSATAVSCLRVPAGWRTSLGRSTSGPARSHE